MATLNTVIINAGEGMNGKRPGFVWEVDSYVPLAKRYGAQSVIHNPPQLWDLDFVLTYGTQFAPAGFPRGLGHGHTFGDLLRVVNTHPKYWEDYQCIERAVTSRAPLEWGVDLNSYVRNLGAGQKLQMGVLKVLAALALGMDKNMVANLLEQEARIVMMFGGLTGGTGAAAFLALKPMLERAGFSSIVSVGALTHVPSIQVHGVVEEHTVERVAAMLDLVPNMVVFTGLQTTGPDGLNVWDDLKTVAPRVAELLSNVSKLHEVHGTTEHMWLSAFNLRPDLVLRWFARILTSSSQVTPDEATRVIKMYVDNGYLDWGAPDINGYHPIRLRNRELLHLEHLASLLPSLVYVKHNPVHITGEIRSGVLKRTSKYDVQLMGSDFVDEILQAAGARDVKDLQLNGREYTGIARYEDWLIGHAQKYTWQQAEAYWKRTWIELAQLYNGWLFGQDVCFEPSEHVAGETRYMSWVQPKISTDDLAVRALGVLGEVQDPRERRNREEAAAALRANGLAKRQALMDEVENRLK